MSELYDRIAREEGIDPRVFRALIGQESGGRQSAVSPKGARGRTQLMPATARGLGVNPNDPTDNLRGGARYLRQQLDRFGRLDLALAAYNAGPGAVEKYKGIPPYAETQAYVKNILAKLGESPGPARSKSASDKTDGDEPAQDVEGALVDVLRSRARQKIGSKRQPIMEGLAKALASGEYNGVRASNTDVAQHARGKAETTSSGSTAITELFWQGPNGINIKNGKRVPQGFVDGHETHVHVAAPTRELIIRFGKLAQSMGLKVGENSYFTGKRVTSGHAERSNHYEDLAIDVSGDPKKMAAYARRVATMAGVK